MADITPPDFLIVDGAIPPLRCGDLARVWLDNPQARETDHIEFWSGRIIGYATVRKIDPVAASMIREHLRWTIREVRRFYGCGPLYADAAHLVGWPEGIELPPHVDDLEEGFGHRAFSAIFYLTSDHEGGELHLPNHGIEIAAQRGRFVSMPCGPSHEHGVRRVISGTRITLAFFLTADPRLAFRLMHPELG